MPHSQDNSSLKTKSSNSSKLSQSKSGTSWTRMLNWFKHKRKTSNISESSFNLSTDMDYVDVNTKRRKEKDIEEVHVSDANYDEEDTSVILEDYEVVENEVGDEDDSGENECDKEDSDDEFKLQEEESDSTKTDVTIEVNPEEIEEEKEIIPYSMKTRGGVKNEPPEVKIFAHRRGYRMNDGDFKSYQDIFTLMNDTMILGMNREISSNKSFKDMFDLFQYGVWYTEGEPLAYDEEILPGRTTKVVKYHLDMCKLDPTKHDYEDYAKRWTKYHRDKWVTVKKSTI